MVTCAIKKCRRQADGEILFQGNEVCLFHEKRHFESKDPGYIWKRLGIWERLNEKETQLKLQED